jgi:hypothetical protein
MSSSISDAAVRRPRWPWVVLASGLLWTVLIRVPLVMNAHDHLDSDLAVDGLTLRDAVHGHWRWHYPGTPYMGVLPLLTSYPQALVWGANPTTLVSGGTVIWLLVIGTTFWLAARAYGLDVAGWAILPLVFSSLGTIWLSGRITGGHLLTLVWHTAAFAGLYECLTRGGRARAAALGVWCGLGLYLDAMFLFTFAGMVAAALFAWLATGKLRAGIGLTAVFALGMLAGLVPREIGRAVDPYDAYPSQFEATLDPRAIAEHARLLFLQCLPRLVAGVEFNQAERASASLDARGRGLTGSIVSTMRSIGRGQGEWPAILLMGACLYSIIRLGRDAGFTADAARKAVGGGVVASALLIVVAFLLNRNIYNSDNYRYLVYMLTPWALGSGLVLSDLARRGWVARLAAGLAIFLLFTVMTSAAFFWYRDGRGYVDSRGIPLQLRRPAWSELKVIPDVSRGAREAATTFVIEPDVTHVMGSYWNVYKLAFLSGGRLVGVPFPIYPNRFPGWSRGLGPGSGKLLILHLEVPGRKPGSTSSAEMGTEAVRSARKINWRRGLKTVWESDRRDPAELSRLSVVVP